MPEVLVRLDKRESMDFGLSVDTPRRPSDHLAMDWVFQRYRYIVRTVGVRSGMPQSKVRVSEFMT